MGHYDEYRQQDREQEEKRQNEDADQRIAELIKKHISKAPLHHKKVAIEILENIDKWAGFFDVLKNIVK